MSLYDKIFTLDSIHQPLLLWKSLNKKIVFTNGCFDLLHKGHVDYLEKAKNLGDILIVGINSDSSVSELKGKNRPIQDESSRVAIVAALASVDATLVFTEETPIELIRNIKPDLLCKGGDWPIEKLIGSEFVQSYGGRVITIPFIQGYSTSNIEQKIRDQK
jgi:D-glycero-beta-D-manno-heptose 1-phosphate adenylyltransferase